MRFQVEVDKERCTACAKCYTVDIEHFESDAVGKSRVRGGTINSKSVGNFNGKLTQVHEAEFSCPVRAIKVIWESELMPGYPTL